VVECGVTILGPLNLPSTIPVHASQMYARNISTFLLSMVKEGRLAPDANDQIVRETMIIDRGTVVHPQLVPLVRSGAKQ